MRMVGMRGSEWVDCWVGGTAVGMGLRWDDGTVVGMGVKMVGWTDFGMVQW